MKSFSISLVAAAFALNEAGAFSVRPQFSSPRPRISLVDRSCRPSTTSSLQAATVGSGSSSHGNNSANNRRGRTLTLNEQLELETIRTELIQKYITLGHTEDYAEKEVDYFLEDEERSRQYVEMRRVAMARGNDLGIEMFVQFGLAFGVGMMGSWLIHSWDAYQVCVLWSDTIACVFANSFGCVVI